LLLIVNIDIALKKFISQEIDTNESKNGISKLLYYYFFKFANNNNFIFSI